MLRKSNLPTSGSKLSSSNSENLETYHKQKDGVQSRKKLPDEDPNLSDTNLRHNFDLGNDSDCYISGFNDQSNQYESSNDGHVIVLGIPLSTESSDGNSKSSCWEQEDEEIKKMPKNSNVLKHVLKKFVEKGFSRNLKKQFEDEDKKISNEIFGFIQKEKRHYKQYLNHNNNREQMVRIFGNEHDSKNPELRSFLLRKHFSHCIRRTLIKEVFNNKQITSLKKSYVYSMLVQMYRCGNIELMSRTQIL